MKARLTKETIQEILNNPEKAANAKIDIKDPWWVIVLKVAAYLIGLLLAGIGSAEAATMAINIM